MEEDIEMNDDQEATAKDIRILDDALSDDDMVAVETELATEDFPPPLAIPKPLAEGIHPHKERFIAYSTNRC